MKQVLKVLGTTVLGMVLGMAALTGIAFWTLNGPHEQASVSVLESIPPNLKIRTSGGRASREFVKRIVAHPGVTPSFYVPKSVRVGMVVYQVRFARHADLRDEHVYGLSSMPEQSIWLDDGRDADFTRCILLHEILHQVREVGSTFQSDDNLDTESFIQSEDKILALVFKQNPEVVKFLSGGL